MSYFDYLPDDITNKLVRYVSQRPSHPSWLASTDVSDVSTLLGFNHNVRRRLQEQINHLVVTLRQVPLRDDDAVIVHCTKHDKYLPDLFHHLGHSLRKVTFEKFAMRCGNCEELKKFLVVNCAGLRALKIDDFIDDSDMDEILRKRGQDLEELSLCFMGNMAKHQDTYWNMVWKAACSLQPLPRAYVIEKQLQSIADYCPKLRTLHLDFLSTSTMPVWWTLGSTLQVLTVRFSPSIDASRTIRFIEQHCRQLQSVEILASSSGFSLMESEAVTRLYASYGAQLRRASLQDIDPACCSLVRANCPNARCSVGHHYRVSEQLAVLGPLVSDVRFDHLWNNVQVGRGAQLRSSVASCTRIENIRGRILGSYCLWSLEAFCSIFERPHPELVSFSWPKWLIDKEELNEALHALAINTCNLREVKVHCESWQLGMFGELVEANPKLRHVHIALDGQTFYTLLVILDIVDTFSRCSRLEQLVVSYDDGEGLARHIDYSLSAITAACSSLRERDVFVRIGSLDFVA